MANIFETKHEPVTGAQAALPEFAVASAQAPSMDNFAPLPNSNIKGAPSVSNLEPKKRGCHY